MACGTLEKTQLSLLYLGVPALSSTHLTGWLPSARRASREGGLSCVQNSAFLIRDTALSPGRLQRSLHQRLQKMNEI